MILCVIVTMSNKRFEQNYQIRFPLVNLQSLFTNPTSSIGDDHCPGPEPEPILSHRGLYRINCLLLLQFHRALPFEISQCFFLAFSALAVRETHRPIALHCKPFTWHYSVDQICAVYWIKVVIRVGQLKRGERRHHSERYNKNGLLNILPRAVQNKRDSFLNP